VTANEGNTIITITNLTSQTISQHIDTNMEIDSLAITGNILLVFDRETITAWHLMLENARDSDPASRKPSRNGSIWTVSRGMHFSIQDQTAVIVMRGGSGVHAYYTGTGEVIEATHPPIHCDHFYYSFELYACKHYPHFSSMCHPDASKGGWWISHKEWVRDPEGKHRLWIPIEERRYAGTSGWLHDITTMQFAPQDSDRTIIIML